MTNNTKELIERIDRTIRMLWDDESIKYQGALNTLRECQSELQFYHENCVVIEEDEEPREGDLVKLVCDDWTPAYQLLDKRDFEPNGALGEKSIWAVEQILTRNGLPVITKKKEG